MKNLFNDISKEEKNRILEMHSSKKNVMSEQSIGGAIDWVKDTAKSILPKSVIDLGKKFIDSISDFDAHAVIEGDMSVSLEVVGFVTSYDAVIMYFKDNDNKTILYVKNFEGPVYNTAMDGKVKYKDISFSNIGMDDWKNIAKRHNIQVSKIMV
jgi:hypothetical protein